MFSLLILHFREMNQLNILSSNDFFFLGLKEPLVLPNLPLCFLSAASSSVRDL